jgi:hypothetical protein
VKEEVDLAFMVVGLDIYQGADGRDIFEETRYYMFPLFDGHICERSRKVF